MSDEARIKRERDARKEAERLLDEKSRELFAVQTKYDKLERSVNRRIVRERNARKAAERLLDEKSRELFATNQQLQQTHDELEQRVAERTADLQQAKEVAESANRTKTLFLASMSHEIRTPLNGVIGMADFLLTSQLEDDLNDAAQTIKQSSETLLIILSNILDYAKLDARKVERHDRPTDVRQLIDGVAKATKLAECVELRLEISADIPKLVLLDPTHLQQVLTHLLANAARHTVKGRVTVAATYTSSKLHFSISDTGDGIPTHRLATLFEPFRRLEQEGYRSTAGAGLGLAICQQLVALMQGEIDVESEEDVGTTFTFWISAEVPLTPHVVVIEPNQMQQRVLLTLLRLLNYDTTAITAADQALPSTATHILANVTAHDWFSSSDVPIIWLGKHGDLQFPVTKNNLKKSIENG